MNAVLVILYIASGHPAEAVVELPNMAVCHQWQSRVFDEFPWHVESARCHGPSFVWTPPESAARGIYCGVGAQPCAAREESGK